MSPTQILIRLSVRTLPERLRDRYREEWLADLQRVPELGVSRLAVLAGALAMSAGLDRDDPAVTGIPVKVETIRRARWSASFLCGALILAFGAFMYSLRGFAPYLDGGALAAASTPVLTLIASFALIGIAKGIGAVRIGIAAYGVKWVVRMVLLGVGVVLAVPFVSIFPIFGMLMALAGVTTALFLAAGGPRGQLPQQPFTAMSRVGLSSMLALLAVGVVVVGVLHILVWNPLAKMPGMGLSDIYAAMAEAQQPSGVVVVATWAALFIAAALALPICCSLKRFAGPRSTRRIIVAGVMLVTTAGVTQWLAGFTTGMSMADTFFISGGDAAISGALLNVATLLGMIVAVFAALVPARWQDAERVSETRVGRSAEP